MFEHPVYKDSTEDWFKWRLTYKGGTQFREQYLKKFSGRESDADFKKRKEITYIPAAAKSAVNEVKNAIFQRISDVKRMGGSDRYDQAMKGLGSGVDGKGTSMGHFIGKQVLPTLLTMAKVGVLLDANKTGSGTLADTKIDPYMTVYQPEDIVNWVCQDPGQPGQFKAVLLNHRTCENNEFGLPTDIVTTTKLWTLTETGVRVDTLEAEKREGDDKAEVRAVKTQFLAGLDRIPFVVFALTGSLLEDVAEYQIALLNIASSDVSFIVRANYPTYVEQRSSKNYGRHFKRPPAPAATEPNSTNTASDGSKVNPTSPTDTSDEVSLGSLDGRAYAEGMDAPSFIAPPTEPIESSMAKQDQMKQEVRQLVHLALSEIKAVSAQAKKMDMSGLESGLSYIGLELEFGERRLAEFWAMYEKKNVAEVKYPERYSLKSDQEVLDEIESLAERKHDVSSTAYRKEIEKKIAVTMLQDSVSDDVLQKILKEIEKSKTTVTDPDIVLRANEEGLMTDEAAAEAIGAQPEEVKKAREDRAARVSLVLQLQSKAAASGQNAPDGESRGVNELGGDAKGEKKRSQANIGAGKRVRGKGKKTRPSPTSSAAR